MVPSTLLLEPPLNMQSPLPEDDPEPWGEELSCFSSLCDEDLGEPKEMLKFYYLGKLRQSRFEKEITNSSLVS